VQSFAQIMNIPVETQLAEFGPGQFEINLKHQSNALDAADHAVLFKQLVDRAASECGTPNANSYRRLQPDNFAPVRLDWGYDHRGVAVRIPETSGPGARIEHRGPGCERLPCCFVQPDFCWSRSFSQASATQKLEF